MPFGAVLDDGGVRFRLWAPAARIVDVEIGAFEGTTIEDGFASGRLAACGEGWFELHTSRARAGSLYRFRIDETVPVPDPASRFQPYGVHGPSEVIDPGAYSWSAAEWTRPAWEALAFYELHIGTFTPGGTFRAAIERLDDLEALGATALQVMPVAQAAGARNWGYDGALPFAPSCAYGRPDDFKAFVDAAHQRGLAVFLDAVYNHFGPEGNYLGRYAPQFFTERHWTPWGAALDFEQHPQVREFFLHNALYWVEEYGIDGLRLDAVHAIFDASSPGFLTELSARLVSAGAGTKCGKAYAVLENDANQAWLLRDFGAQWNDDVHHALHVLVTEETDGYYADYAAEPQRLLARALAEGFAFQGEASGFRGGVPRGEPSADLAPTAFVTFLQNHDQVGNRAFGERIAALAPPERIRAAAAVYLLTPSLPLVFMGEEWAASSPFAFFCDFETDLAHRVRDGRRAEFAAFAQFGDETQRKRIPDPGALETFARSRLRWNERTHEPHRAMLSFYTAALAARAQGVVPLLTGAPAKTSYADAARGGFAVRWDFASGALCVLANLSAQRLETAPFARLDERGGEPLFAAGDGVEKACVKGAALPPWSVIWCRTA